MTQKPINLTKSLSVSSQQLQTSVLNEKFSKEIELNRRYFIVGERRISSYWWASVFFVGGFGFLITGISSYIKYNLFTSVYRVIESFINNSFFKTFRTLVGAFFSTFAEKTTSITTNEIGQILPSSSDSYPFVIEGTGGEGLIFFPQGLLLCFYGSLALLLSLYWWLLIYWNVGGGFNEFNKKEGFMRIFRWGYPGKNRRIDIVYPLKDIEAIRVELNQSPGSSLLTAEQTIFVRLLSAPKELEKEQTRLGFEASPSDSSKKTISTKEVVSVPYNDDKGLPYNNDKGQEKGPTQELSKLEEVDLKKGVSLNKKGTPSLLKIGSGAKQKGSVLEEKIKREIPLGGIGQPLTLKEIEKQASELANYLQVALEGL